MGWHRHHIFLMLVKAVEQALKVNKRFAMAYSPWSNGTCETMIPEVIRTLKGMLHERKREVREWVNLVPAVQWALNTAFRERYASTLYHVIFGRALSTGFATLVSSGGEWRVDVLDAGA